MKVYNQISDLIGKTPLLELTNYEKENNIQAKIIAKLEYFNPAGSVKDRIAKFMIDDAEKRGVLKKDLLNKVKKNFKKSQNFFLRKE